MKIVCRRGPLKKFKIIVKDKSDNEYYCTFTKLLFDALPDSRPIEVTRVNDDSSKKFMKNYLQFVKELQ